MNGDRVVTPAFVQSVPPSGCSKVFEEAKVTRAYAPPAGNYGDTFRTAQVLVYVNSNGGVVQAQVWKSSGVDGLDAAALGASEAAKYSSARFLCVPVVGVYLFRMDYHP